MFQNVFERVVDVEKVVSVVVGEGEVEGLCFILFCVEILDCNFDEMDCECLFENFWKVWLVVDDFGDVLVDCGGK